MIGFLILALGAPEYAQRTWAAITFVAYLLWQIVLSTIPVVRDHEPRDITQPGIVAVPLRALTTTELLLLASSITLTPGTISVETGSGPDGGRVLFVHALFAGDPERMRREIRERVRGAHPALHARPERGSCRLSRITAPGSRF